MSVLTTSNSIKLSDIDRRSVVNKDGIERSLHSNCKHEDSDHELRRHVIASGFTHYKFECQICGRRGHPISKHDPIRTALTTDPPYVNPEIAERYWIEVEKERAKVSDSRHDEYTKYLDSPKWRAKRKLVIARDQHQCQAKLDGCTNAAEHVHHLTYDHLFNEPLFELVAVCRSCHNKIHGRELTILGVAQ